MYEGRHYSYREINETANRLAHWLIAQGIGTEDRVAVLLDKSPELVITALGIVKAGAVYLPIDPTYPEDRLSYILSDSDPEVVLRAPATDLDEHPGTDPTDADRVRPLLPENTAYLIYTSGSTGLPKGVPVPHRPIAEYFAWFGPEYEVSDSDRLLQVASQSFDVSIGEIFGMLAAGARLVIPKPDGLTDIGYLTDLLRNEGITSMHFVPSLLGLFLSLPGVDEWRTLQRVPIGGEALPGEVADKFHATFDSLLHNFYGPTETVLNCSRYKVEGKQGIAHRADRHAEDQHQHPPARRLPAAGAGRCDRRDLHRRNTCRARLPRPAGPDRRAVRRRPVQPGRPDVPLRRPGPPKCGRRHRIRRPRRRAGQDPRLPDRTRRGGRRHLGRPVGRSGRRGGQRAAGAGQEPGRLRHPGR